MVREARTSFPAHTNNLLKQSLRSGLFPQTEINDHPTVSFVDLFYQKLVLGRIGLV